MDREFIMQMRPWIGDEERQAVNDYMQTDGFLTEFKLTEEFENSIKEYTSAKYCFAVNNGTISLTLAALALGIGPGDEVIVPNFTMVASPNSVKMLGAMPIFVDVEPETLCMDFTKLERACGPKTKAIMLVSANGRYPLVDINEFVNFANEKNLKIIEDSAQALGSFYPNGTHIGLLGDIGSISFSMPKIITTGQGGALITNNDDLAEKIKLLKNFGRASSGNDQHQTIGFNSKFTEMQAAIGVEQMKKLSTRVDLKKKIWTRYRENLKDLPAMTLFEHNLETTAPWFIDAVCDDRDGLKSFLALNRIGSREMYPPLNQQEAYNEPGEYPVSFNIGHKGLWLPSAAQLQEEEIDYVTSKIQEFYS
jgi:perosamine synthetase